MPAIESLHAIEILDGRGRPTVLCRCMLAGGAAASAFVSSGASTGGAEALELRDGEPQRYRGLGCRKAVAHINQALNDALAGQAFEDQEALDLELIDQDGTENKSRLGANAILAVSLAFARASACDAGLPLYQHFAELVGMEPRMLPRPTIHLFSGDRHTGRQMPIRDVLVVPASATTMGEALAVVYEVHQSAADLVREKYNMRALSADEGGLPPPFVSAEAMLEDAVESIRQAGFAPGREVSLAVDVASSRLFQDGFYHLGDDPPRDSQAMIERLAYWVQSYPIVSLEDGLSREDWAHWPLLRQTLGSRCLIVGADFLCTNPERIRQAIESDACTALLLKVNQIGTLSEAAHAMRLARSAGWNVTVSAASGETEDNWLADLAVGWGGDQIKVGSITRSERLAKYNRLLVIEDELGLPMVYWPNLAPVQGGQES